MLDVNLRGTLCGIAAAPPVSVRQQAGHIVSTAGFRILPTMGVHAAAKNAVLTATEALRQENRFIRTTEVSPGYVATDFAQTIPDSDVLALIESRKMAFTIPPKAIVRTAYAVEQPDDVEVGSIIMPTAQD